MRPQNIANSGAWAMLQTIGDVVRSTLLLGLTFAVIAAAGDTSYALLAGRVGAWLSQKRIRAIEIISGTCLVGGAAWMVLKGR